MIPKGYFVIAYSCYGWIELVGMAPSFLSTHQIKISHKFWRLKGREVKRCIRAKEWNRRKGMWMIKRQWMTLLFYTVISLKDLLCPTGSRLNFHRPILFSFWLLVTLVNVRSLIFYTVCLRKIEWCQRSLNNE